MSVNEMDLRDIEYFAVVAEHRHLGRAAEALKLSTPALSKSLRRLENSTQSKLVKRTPKGIELTAEGATLLSRVRELRVSLRDLTREIADLRNGRAGDLRIGAAPGFAEYLLPEACDAMFRASSKVTFTVTVATNEVIVPALRNGDLDLIVTMAPTVSANDLVHEYLCDDEFAVGASVHHRLARPQRVTIADLVKERWAAPSKGPVWQRMLQSFEDHGFPPPKIAMVSNSAWFRLRTVAATELLAVSSGPLLRLAAPLMQLTILPVQELTWVRRVSLLYRKDAYVSPAAQRFIDILKETAKDNHNSKEINGAGSGRVHFPEM